NALLSSSRRYLPDKPPNGVAVGMKVAVGLGVFVDVGASVAVNIGALVEVIVAAGAQADRRKRMSNDKLSFFILFPFC
ncbi:MAG: hypothetical protein HY258_13565, partial [Chloroflexi bacterium]|nr:hypothetical protein [Chloroflexota bacterium]